MTNTSNHKLVNATGNILNENLKTNDKDDGPSILKTATILECDIIHENTNGSSVSHDKGSKPLEKTQSWENSSHLNSQSIKDMLLADSGLKVRHSSLSNGLDRKNVISFQGNRALMNAISRKKLSEISIATPLIDKTASTSRNSLKGRRNSTRRRVSITGNPVARRMSQSYSQESSPFKDELMKQKSFLLEKRKSIPEEASLGLSQHDYYEYMLMSQRYQSSEFIYHAESKDIVYHDESSNFNLKLIGNYVVGGVIGKGAFGKVKEGVDSSSLHRVAIKIVCKKRLKKLSGSINNLKTLIDVFCKVESSDQDIGVFNWFSEIEDEPIVWRTADAVETDKMVQVLKWYLVFDFCSCSLELLIENNGSLTEEYARSMFIQLADGLEYLHSLGIVRKFIWLSLRETDRDIKPGNILISVDNVLKISDFGIAEEFSIYTNDLMTSSSFIGTHKFIAPEVIKGCGKYSVEMVDIWASGVTLYNMLSGQYPFESKSSSGEGDTLVSLYESILNAPCSRPQHISDACADFLQAKNPACRYTIKMMKDSSWFANSVFIQEFSPVMSYPLPPGDSSDQGLITGPQETTMTPYLETLYKKDIERGLEQMGSLSTDSSEKCNQVSLIYLITKETENQKR